MDYNKIISAGNRHVGLYIEAGARNLYEANKKVCDAIVVDDVAFRSKTEIVGVDPAVRKVSFTDKDGNTVDSAYVLGGDDDATFLVDKLTFYFLIKNTVLDAQKEKECSA